MQLGHSRNKWPEGKNLLKTKRSWLLSADPLAPCRPVFEKNTAEKQRFSTDKM